MEKDKVNENFGYYIPIYIPEWNIYDCFYSDSGEIVIICPGETRPNPPKFQLYSISYHNNTPDNKDPENTNNIFEPEKSIWFNEYICPANHTYIYKLSLSAILKTKSGLPHQITIIAKHNGNNATETEQILYICPNKYPSYKGLVVMTTMVKNEDNIIRTWIDFHIRLGIQKFIIYDSFASLETAEGKYINNQPLSPTVFNEKSKLLDLLSDYIKSGQVIIINWPYTKFLITSGISGQTTQQNHAIRAFDTADWIGLFDVDEYINIQRPDIILGAANGQGMRRFLDGIAQKTTLGKSMIGGIQFKNKFFYNPNDLPTANGAFLYISNCAEKIKQLGNEKNFVIPRNVRTFAIHLITSGFKTIVIPPTLGYFNHYIYLNKPSRGRDQTPWHDDSIIRYLI